MKANLLKKFSILRIFPIICILFMLASNLSTISSIGATTFSNQTLRQMLGSKLFSKGFKNYDYGDSVLVAPHTKSLTSTVEQFAFYKSENDNFQNSTEPSEIILVAIVEDAKERSRLNSEFVKILSVRDSLNPNSEDCGLLNVDDYVIFYDLKDASETLDIINNFFEINDIENYKYSNNNGGTAENQAIDNKRSARYIGPDAGYGQSEVSESSVKTGNWGNHLNLSERHKIHYFHTEYVFPNETFIRLLNPLHVNAVMTSIFDNEIYELIDHGAGIKVVDENNNNLLSSHESLGSRTHSYLDILYRQGFDWVSFSTSGYTYNAEHPLLHMANKIVTVTVPVRIKQGVTDEQLEKHMINNEKYPNERGVTSELRFALASIPNCGRLGGTPTVNPLKSVVQKGSVTVRKVDSDTGGVLGGAEFTVTGNGVNQKITTGGDGLATLGDLELGTYTITETKAPNGYVLDNPAWSRQFTLTAQNLQQSYIGNDSIKNKPVVIPKGSVTVRKVASDTGAVLGGAEFTVTGNGVNQKITTGGDGLATLGDLALGTYTITETKAPNGYVLDNPAWSRQFTLTAQNLQQSYIGNDSIRNGPVVIPKGSVTVRKVNSDTGAVLSGGEFTVTGNGVNQKITTGGDGLATLGDLALGTYTITETKAPNGYVLDNPAWSRQFTLTAQNLNQTYNGTDSVPNKKIVIEAPRGWVVVQKIDQETGSLLPGAEFTITGNGVNQKIVTGSDGSAVLENLVLGTYTITETKAPAGYELSNPVWSRQFTLTAEKIGQVYDANNAVPNKKIVTVTPKGGVFVKKVDSESKANLAGAEFTVTGNGVNQKIVTDSNGMGNVQNLELGTYTITETKAPTGYELDTPAWTRQFTLTAQKLTQTYYDTDAIPNKKIVTVVPKGSVSVKKISSDTAGALAGAEFTITGNGVNQKITTGSDGLATLGNLELGAYTITETKAPTGYILGSPAWSVRFTLTAQNLHQSYTEGMNRVKNTPAMGSVTVTKIDSDTGTTLAGAEFTITGNGVNRKITTGSDGKAELQNIMSGTYTITETKAPDGYELSNPAWTKQFTVTEQNPSQVYAGANAVPNKKIVIVSPKGAVAVQKYDQETKAPLAKAEFRVTGNGINETIVTGSSGMAALTNLELGTYTITETKAPDGYELSNPAWTKQFTLTAQNLAQVYDGTNAVPNKKMVVVSPKGAVVVQKIDVESRAALAGAEFTVTGNGVNQKITTDNNGMAALTNLELGTYTITETKAPAGYELSNPAWTKQFTLTAQNLAQIYDGTDAVPNKKIVTVSPKGAVVVQKNDAESKAALAGAEFTVTGNGVNQKIITASNGLAGLNNLELGMYTITETKAPDGYELSTPAWTKQFTLTEQNLTQIYDGTEAVPNKKIVVETPKGSVTIQKVDSESAVVLAEAEFTVTGNGVNQKIITGSDGKATLQNLELGTYTITETRAPAGYELGNPAWTKQFTLTTQNLNQVYDGTNAIPNKKVVVETPKGSVTVQKFDSEGAVVLAEAEFTVTGNDVNQKIITGSDGKATLQNLELGTYTITETKAPAGYELSNPAWTKQFTLTAQNLNQVYDGVNAVPNRKIVVEMPKGSVTIQKVDSESAVVLAEAEFTVTGNDVDQKIVTGSDGKATLQNLELGTYTITETKAPAGYELSNPAWTKQFTLTEQNLNQVYDGVNAIPNRKIVVETPKGSVTVQKVDSESAVVLAEAEFTVTGNDVNQKIITGSDGKATLQNLELGTYTITETKAPAGYELSNPAWTKQFTLTEQNLNQVYDGVNAVPNKKIVIETPKGSVTVQKVDSESAVVLAEAEFTVTGNDVDQKIVTDSDGKAILQNLELGTYTITETKAPAGYELSNPAWTKQFTLTEQNLDQIYDGTEAVPNKKIAKGSVELFKNDENGNLLAGAEFKLFIGIYPNGRELEKDKIYNSNQGVIRVNNLPLDDYYFQEITAPGGYEVNGDGIYKFTLTTENYHQIIKITSINREQKGSVRLLKKEDGTDNTLEGAVFKLYNEDGTLYDEREYVTNSEGVIEINNLSLGDYYFEEIMAPDGYTIMEDGIYQFSITMENYNAVFEIEATNEKDEEILELLGKVRLTKEDVDTGQPLDGAIFQLYKGKSPNGERFNDKDYKTVKGVIEENNLPLGNYYFHEIKPPYNYKIDGNGYIDFTITADNYDELIEVTAENVKSDLPAIHKEVSSDGTINENWGNHLDLEEISKKHYWNIQVDFSTVESEWETIVLEDTFVDILQIYAQEIKMLDEEGKDILIPENLAVFGQRVTYKWMRSEGNYEYLRDKKITLVVPTRIKSGLSQSQLASYIVPNVLNPEYAGIENGSKLILNDDIKIFSEKPTVKPDLEDELPPGSAQTGEYNTMPIFIIFTFMVTFIIIMAVYRSRKMTNNKRIF